MLRKLKNITEHPVTIAVFGFAGPRDGFMDANTQFIKVEPEQSTYVNEHQYRFFVGDEKTPEGFLVSGSVKPVLSPSFELVETLYDFNKCKKMAVVMPANENTLTLEHGVLGSTAIDFKDVTADFTVAIDSADTTKLTITAAATSETEDRIVEFFIVYLD